MISNDLLRVLVRSRLVVDLTRDLVRAVTAVVVLLGLGSAIWFYAHVSIPVLKYLHFNDFGKFYYSALMFREGGDMYGPNPATAIPVANGTVEQFLNMNPPHFHLLVLPLTYLPLATAYLVWGIASLGCLVISLAIVARELGIRWTASTALWTTFVCVSCAATATTVVTGQLTFLLLLPVTIAWRCVRRDDWNRGAWWLGVLASVKPFLGIFALYFLVTRRGGAFLRMAWAATGAFTVGLLVFGTASYLHWLHALGAVSWLWAPMNGSIGALVSRALDGGPFFEPWLRWPDAVKAVSMIAALLATAMTLALVRRDRGFGSTDRAFLGLLLLAQLASPLGWVYYLWLPLGAAAAVWISSRARAFGTSNWLALAAVPGLFLPLVVTLLWRSHRWGGVTVGSAYTWSTLLLWVATLLEVRYNAAGHFARNLDSGRPRPFGADVEPSEVRSLEGGNFS